MNIGILKEDFKKEWRVALTPAGAQSLFEMGNEVYVETEAGLKCSFSDNDYEQVGAKILYSQQEVIGRSNILLKVSPLNEYELEYIDEPKIIFSFLHLEIADRKILELIYNKKISSVGYELIEDKDGNLPIQQVSSEIAGQMAIPLAQRCLENTIGGRGILLGGVPGVPPAAVVILGAGMVGKVAIGAALGVGAHVSVLDADIKRLRTITELFPNRVTTAVANQFNIARGVKYADVFIASMFLAGGKDQYRITEEMVRTMKNGAVILDISIDQGGVFETSRPTTLSDPIFIKHGVIHYCVPNIPSSVARTATYGLTNASVPYIGAVSKYGLESAMDKIDGLSKGVCTLKGKLLKESLKQIYNI